MSLSMYNTLTKIVVIVMALVSTNLYPKNFTVAMRPSLKLLSQPLLRIMMY
jgi:hypothetical protein